jgi:hypothetical protein
VQEDVEETHVSPVPHAEHEVTAPKLNVPEGQGAQDKAAPLGWPHALSDARIENMVTNGPK